jgi:hypothetical protein
MKTRNRLTPKEYSKKYPWVYFWWSASQYNGVRLVGWVRHRMGTGGPDTNKIGVGALIWSDWLFSHPLHNRRQRGGLPQGYYIMRPYHPAYRHAFNGHVRVKVRRPKVADLGSVSTQELIAEHRRDMPEPKPVKVVKQPTRTGPEWRTLAPGVKWCKGCGCVKLAPFEEKPVRYLVPRRERERRKAKVIQNEV